MENFGFRKIFIVYAVLILLVIALLIWRAGSIDFNLPFTQNAKAQIKDKEISLIIADDERERMVGLSNRRSLDTNTGMLFLFDEKAPHQFWMRDMNFPIDIIYLDDNKVVDIVKNAQPPKENESPQIFSPDTPANRVLELNAGKADELGITEGSEISFEGI